MSQAMYYVRELADRIGPRPATTDSEAEAADFIQEVMRAHGLDVERQEFDCPRTYSWSFVTYHALTILSAVGLYFADAWAPLRWLALVVASATALLMFSDLDTKPGLSGWLSPKGPSQNIIARRVPPTRRGERRRKIVVVAHYDSARSSLAFAPAMVKNFAVTFGLMKWCTALVPVLILLDNLAFLSFADPYLLYAALGVSAYLIVPLLINVHRELFMGFVDGANDNASGVAALLGIMERVAPEPEGGVSMPTQPIRRGEPGAGGDWGSTDMAFGVGPAAEVESDDRDGLMEYSPATTPEESLSELPDDFRWAETRRPGETQGMLDLDTVEFDAVVPGEAQAVRPDDRVRDASATGSWGEVETDFDGDGVPDIYEAEIDEARRRQELFGSGSVSDRPADEPHTQERRRKSFFGLGRKKEREEDVSAWLGVGKSFDARDEGRKIGTWDGFEDEDDEMGFKGGWAGDDPIGDADFASNEAHRIRRRVAERVDHDLDEKEIWFVATGAEEAGTWGMRAFLEAYSAELKGAYIINLDNIGTGTLHWVTREGMTRRYRSDRRLVSAARAVSRQDQILVKGSEYKGLSTDATPALARGFKAMSVMAFDINGRLPNWHWHTDTSENVQPENIENAVKLVTGIIRDI